MKTMKSFLNVLLFFSIVMLNPVTAQTPGEIDFSFDPQLGASGVVNTMVLQPDGKIIIGGNFTSYDNVTRTRIARVNSDGSLDTSFDPGTGFNNEVHTIILQSDGKILVGGRFTSYNGIDVGRIVRLNPDGSMDDTFVQGTGFDGTVEVIVFQPDGKILVGGNFESYNGVNKNNIVRLEPDGALEVEFNQGLGPQGRVSTIAVQPDERILIGGSFSSFANFPNTWWIARMLPNGNYDVTFEKPSCINLPVHKIVLQDDGKILVGGDFGAADCPVRIIRLHPGGDVDESFNPLGAGNSSGTSGVAKIILLPNEQILIGGNFTYFNETDIRRIAILNSDGSLDTEFDPGTGFNNTVLDMAVQPDGKIVVVGRFTNYNDINRRRIVRIYGMQNLGVEDHIISNSDWFIIKENGLLKVESKGFEMDEIAVYDLMGRELYKTTNLYATQHKLPAFNSSQILIVRVVSDTGKQLHKKVIN